MDRIADLEPEVATGRLAFVTRGRVSGRAGLAAFDDLCSQEAAAADRNGVFVAAVAIGTTPASERVTVDGPTWVRADGIKLFDSVDDIRRQGTLRVPIQYTADGVDPVNTDVWTGGVDFNEPNFPNCDDWTPGSNEDGVFGKSASLEAVAFGVDSCAATHQVYCFER